MRRKKSLGKRGGVASTLVDIYSIFFYVFVLVLFIFIFSLAKGCCLIGSGCEAQQLSLGSAASDKTIEARMMLLSLLRTPVELSDGRTMDIADLIALNEMSSEDFEEALKDEVTAVVEGYIGYALASAGPEAYVAYIPRSWRFYVDYRSAGKTLTCGGLDFKHQGSGNYYVDPYDYASMTGNIPELAVSACIGTVPATATVPLAYNPDEDSQTAEVGLALCTDFLTPQGGDI